MISMSLAPSLLLNTMVAWLCLGAYSTGPKGSPPSNDAAARGPRASCFSRIATALGAWVVGRTMMSLSGHERAAGRQAVQQQGAANQKCTRSSSGGSRHTSTPAAPKASGSRAHCHCGGVVDSHAAAAQGTIGHKQRTHKQAPARAGGSSMLNLSLRRFPSLCPPSLASPCCRPCSTSSSSRNRCTSLKVTGGTPEPATPSPASTCRTVGVAPSSQLRSSRVVSSQHSPGYLRSTASSRAHSSSSSSVGKPSPLLCGALSPSTPLLAGGRRKVVDALEVNWRGAMRSSDSPDAGQTASSKDQASPALLDLRQRFARVKKTPAVRLDQHKEELEAVQKITTLKAELQLAKAQARQQARLLRAKEEEARASNESLVMLSTSLVELGEYVTQLEPTLKAVWGRMSELEGEVVMLQREKASALDEAQYQSRACDNALSRLAGDEEKLERALRKLEKTQAARLSAEAAAEDAKETVCSIRADNTELHEELLKAQSHRHYLDQCLQRDALVECDCQGSSSSTCCPSCAAHHAQVAELQQLEEEELEGVDLYDCAVVSGASTPRDSTTTEDSSGRSSMWEDDESEEFGSTQATPAGVPALRLTALLEVRQFEEELGGGEEQDIPVCIAATLRAAGCREVSTEAIADGVCAIDSAIHGAGDEHGLVFAAVHDATQQLLLPSVSVAGSSAAEASRAARLAASELLDLPGVSRLLQDDHYALEVLVAAKAACGRVIEPQLLQLVLDAIDEAYDEFSKSQDVSDLWSVLKQIAATLI